MDIRTFYYTTTLIKPTYYFQHLLLYKWKVYLHFQIKKICYNSQPEQNFKAISNNSTF